MRTPIWKRGSLASDSNVSMNRSPAFLVDSAVTSSMSGSPVLRRFGYKSRISESGTIVETASYNLIGVYAGRLQRADLEQTNLGFAWYRSEEHTSELQSLMRISYAVFCLKKKKSKKTQRNTKKITKIDLHRKR